ncbi:MAG TPA: hypothetical protein PLX89_24745 [Verrucomicrobiota bacterium]|nr:hypothetical protein [Verrucomicrobiales bacterium]HRI16217.1 hypothetical protein [Verrucomicrobiota bacterium]
MNLLGRVGLGLVAVWLAAVPVVAHVGSPFIVFEGRAGDFPVQVVVRQPEVVPGLAEISVRILGGNPTGVRVLPLHGNTDKSGAPRPDIAKPVPGETNLYTAALWFMNRGAYGIEVQVEGPSGGTAIVPVNSVAYDRKSMPAGLGIALAIVGAGLALGVIAIAMAAAREATLPAGVPPSRGRWGWAALAGFVGVTAVGGAIFGGSAWWNQEDTRHITRVLYRQLAHKVTTVPAGSGTQLQLTLTDSRYGLRPYRPVPEHGKLVHLFVVGEDTSLGVPALAHLHPHESGEKEFTCRLPNLPAGRYRVFTELTHEEGFTQTLTNSLELAEQTTATGWSDPDDSAASAGPGAMSPVPVGDGLMVHLRVQAALPGEVSRLEARIDQADGAPAPLEPYLRMLGHAVVMRDDGSVFGHLHPAGSLSMAAARTFARKLDGEAGVKATDANCGDLEAVPAAVAAALGRRGEVSFPYVFPNAGNYFVWIQVKVAGRIYTAPFRVTIGGQRAVATSSEREPTEAVEG